MSLFMPIHWFHSRTDLMWPVDPFKEPLKNWNNFAIGNFV